MAGISLSDMVSATAAPPDGLSRWRLIAGLSFGMAAVSCGSVLVRLTQAQGVPSLEIAAWRMLLASLLLQPYAWARQRQEWRLLGRRDWALLLLSGAFLALHFGTWIASLALTSVASSVVLVSMGPLFVGIGSWAFLHERPGRSLVLGLLLALAGTVLIAWGDFGGGRSHLLGDALALAGAVGVAGYLMIGGRARRHLSLTAYITPVYSAAALVLCAVVSAQALLAHRASASLIAYPLPAYVLLLGLAILPQLVGHSSLNWALKHLSATYVAVVTLSEPVGASLLAYFVLGEPPPATAVLGGAVILCGIYIAGRGRPPAAAVIPAETREHLWTGVSADEH